MCDPRLRRSALVKLIKARANPEVVTTSNYRMATKQSFSCDRVETGWMAADTAMRMDPIYGSISKTVL